MVCCFEKKGKSFYYAIVVGIEILNSQWKPLRLLFYSYSLCDRVDHIAIIRIILNE